jgi:hypothetical protein
MSPDLRTAARAPARRGRLGFGLYLVPGFPSWEHSLAAVRAAVAAGVDFIEFPIIRRIELSASTGGVVAGALTAAGTDELDPDCAGLSGWLAEVPVPVGVVYRSAWPEPDDLRAPAELVRRCAGLVCEHDATPIAAFADRARRSGTALVPTVRADPKPVTSSESDTLRCGDGFVYLALSSTTGSTGSIGPTLADRIEAIRGTRPDLPVYAAFGIRNADDVAAVAQQGADGFIVGSRALDLLRTGGLDAFTGWLDHMLAACAMPTQVRAGHSNP